jgi:hypothetical protein
MARSIRPALRVELWTYCYRCNRFFGTNPPPPALRHLIHAPRPTPWATHQHQPMWLWDYAFRTDSGLRVYTRSQFRTWDRARASAAKQYPRVLKDLADIDLSEPGSGAAVWTVYPLHINESLY